AGGIGSGSGSAPPPFSHACLVTPVAASELTMSLGFSKFSLARLGLFPPTPCRQSVGASFFGIGTLTRWRHSGLGHRTFLPALASGSVDLCWQNWQVTGVACSGATSSFFSGGAARPEGGGASMAGGGRGGRGEGARGGVRVGLSC